jgi:hypothetical protein
MQTLQVALLDTLGVPADVRRVGAADRRCTGPPAFTDRAIQSVRCANIPKTDENDWGIPVGKPILAIEYVPFGDYHWWIVVCLKLEAGGREELCPKMFLVLAQWRRRWQTSAACGHAGP